MTNNDLKTIIRFLSETYGVGCYTKDLVLSDKEESFGDEVVSSECSFFGECLQRR